MKKLKIIGVPWHTGHQAELSKLPFVEQYDLLLNPWRPDFSTEQRPFPTNFNYVGHYEKGKYDLAILHLDQQSIFDPELSQRISKGRVYMEANDIIDDIPKIVINHHTPHHDQLPTDVVVEKIKQLVGSNTMVVNSYEARDQWGFGEVITHGLQPEEWWDLPKEPRCVIVLSAAGMDTAYRREFAHAVLRKLEPYNLPVEWIGVSRKSFKSWDEYRTYLGRSLLFFFPAWQSPRPRARTEAMLSGCCVVTTPYHDASNFINSGTYKEIQGVGQVQYDQNTTGFLTSMNPMKDPRIMDSPDYTASLIKHLLTEAPDIALQVGQQGKKYAQENFNSFSFAEQWSNLLHKLNVL